jgi:glycosyltransferase involved in cell wall biosynthesis
MPEITQASDKQPLVTVGVPVYNGEEYIQSALDSLLSQIYQNIKIVISDNASVDHTAEICQEYEKKYKKIRYYKNDVNYGSVYNYNKLVDLSDGKYFMWASSHDLWDPSFISKCVSIMEEEKNVVLVYSRTLLIDTDNKPLMITPDEIDTRGMNAVSRYVSIISNLQWCNMFSGVIRRNALIKCERLKDTIGPDNTFLAELSLRGSFAQIKEKLYLRRKIRKDESPEEYKQRVLNDLNPIKSNEKNRSSLRSLLTQLCAEHLKIISHSSLSIIDKILLKIITIYILKKKFNIVFFKLIKNLCF